MKLILLLQQLYKPVSGIWKSLKDPVSSVKNRTLRWGIRLIALTSVILACYFVSQRWYPDSTLPQAGGSPPITAIVPPPVVGSNTPAAVPPPPKAVVQPAQPEKLSFLEVVTYISTLLTALAGIYTYAVKPGWKLWKNVSQLLERVEKIYNEVRPNGGGSLYDVIKRIERQSTSAIERHRALIDSLHIIRFEATADGACEWVSTAYLELAGASMEEVLGSGWVSVIHPDDRVKVVEEWWSCMKHRRVFNMEYRFVNIKTNEANVVRCHSKPIVQNDQIVGYVGTIHPVSGHYADKYDQQPIR